MSLFALLAALPALYWTGPVDTAPTLREAGIEQVLVPPELLEAWKKADFRATALSAAERGAREKLPAPGIQGQGTLASATRTPWVFANGWRFVRKPGGRYAYETPPGRAALAAAEAFAYGADAVLEIKPEDLGELGRMLAFLREVPAADLPAVADIDLVDDGSPVASEVMNLLARRNLLFRVADPRVRQGGAHRRARLEGVPEAGGRRPERLRPEGAPGARGRAALPATLWQRGGDGQAHGRRDAGPARPRELRRARCGGPAGAGARPLRGGRSARGRVRGGWRSRRSR